MDGHEPDVVIRSELQERPPFAEGVERAVHSDGARMAFRLLVAHQRRRIVAWHVDRAACGGRRGRSPSHSAAHKDRRVLRPVARVLVKLERPVDLHLVPFHPVHFHVPGAFRRGAERIDVSVLGAVGVVALMLVVVVAAVVCRFHVRGLGAEAGDVVAASVRLEGAADLAMHTVDHRTAHLHHLDVQEAVERAGIVVGHHYLPLELPVGVEHLRGRVNVESADDHVGDDLRHAGDDIGDAAVADREDVVVAEELDELAGEVDARAVVGMVRPVDAARTPRAREGDSVGHRPVRSAGELPREAHRAALRGEDAVIVLVEDELVALILGKRKVGGVGGRPVDAVRRLDDVRQVVVGLGALERETRLGGGEGELRLVQLLDARDAARRRGDGHRREVRVGGEPWVVRSVVRQVHRRRGRNPQYIRWIIRSRQDGCARRGCNHR